MKKKIRKHHWCNRVHISWENGYILHVLCVNKGSPTESVCDTDNCLCLQCGEAGGLNVQREDIQFKHGLVCVCVRCNRQKLKKKTQRKSQITIWEEYFDILRKTYWVSCREGRDYRYHTHICTLNMKLE